MDTVKEFVDLWKRPAYLFRNNFGNVRKWMYFIPIGEYDEVIEDKVLKQEDTFGIIKNKGKEVAKIRDLMRKPFLNGDPNVFIVPLYFEDKPEKNIIATN